MKWQEIKFKLNEDTSKVIIAVEFESGRKITIKNVPQNLTTRPDFEQRVIRAARKAKPNETFVSWGIVGDEEAAQIDKQADNVEQEKVSGKGTPDAFEPSEIEKQAMKNVLDLHRLVLNTMEQTVFKGLKPNTNTMIDQGYYYLPRTKDPEFPSNVSFTFPVTYPEMNGKTETIDDIKDQLMIDVKINTKNPKKDNIGYQIHEGFPISLGDYDDLKQMVIDSVGAREHITTVGPASPKQKPGGPMRVHISAKSFYYRNAIVPNTDKE
jgi:hypothetical protein